MGRVKALWEDEVINVHHEVVHGQARYEKRREWFQKKKIAIREKFMKLGERKNNETK